MPVFVWSLVYIYNRHMNFSRFQLFHLSIVGYWKVDRHRYRSAFAAARHTPCKHSCSKIPWIACCHVDKRTASLTWAWSRHLWPGGWRWHPLGGWCLPSPACRRRRLRAWCHHYWRPVRQCWLGSGGTDTGVSCWRGPRCSQSRLSHLVEGES